MKRSLHVKIFFFQFEINSKLTFYETKIDCLLISAISVFGRRGINSKYKKFNFYIPRTFNQGSAKPGAKKKLRLYGFYIMYGDFIRINVIAFLYKLEKITLKLFRFGLRGIINLTNVN